MKNKLGIVACSLFLAAGALCVAAVLPMPDFAVEAAACSHDGYHYTEHNASDTEYGCREYWICCSCHTVFTNVTTGAPTSGTWKDNGRANIDFTEADKADPRFIDKIQKKEMETILTNLGFKTVKQLADGTWEIGNYNGGNTINVPEGVSTIDADTFKGNQMDWVVIPYSVTNCAAMTKTGASKLTYYFVGDTNETTSTLRCNYLYKIQEVGWHYENGIPTPGKNPNL